MCDWLLGSLPLQSLLPDSAVSTWLTLRKDQWPAAVCCQRAWLAERLLPQQPLLLLFGAAWALVWGKHFRSSRWVLTLTCDDPVLMCLLWLKHQRPIGQTKGQSCLSECRSKMELSILCIIKAGSRSWGRPTWLCLSNTAITCYFMGSFLPGLLLESTGTPGAITGFADLHSDYHLLMLSSRDKCFTFII